jgi:hypothetical protein
VTIETNILETNFLGFSDFIENQDGQLFTKFADKIPQGYIYPTFGGNTCGAYCSLENTLKLLTIKLKQQQ